VNKRYLLFCSWYHYPQGGWGDFVGAFVSKDMASDEGRKMISSDQLNYDWYQVVDADSNDRGG
jgi:hypothetical protein